MTLTFAIAIASDAAEISALRNAAAERLTQEFGVGPWSWASTERGVLQCLQRPQFERTLIARDGTEMAATLHLQTRKPWAINIAYFTPVPKALYLVSMAVHPGYQRAGVGRAILKYAEHIARNWSQLNGNDNALPGNTKAKTTRAAKEPPVTAIRLDAWDSPAGAGPFYAKCGYREMGRVVYRSAPLIYYELLL
jgi:GNAT superfamily N-acetyltransferase